MVLSAWNVCPGCNKEMPGYPKRDPPRRCIGCSGIPRGISYRYTLFRNYLVGEGTCLFIMLNPSTADVSHDDPTVRRCQGFARKWGYGRLEVVNLFAARATDPSEMKKMDNPIGIDNDAAIVDAVQDAALVICAWGNHGTHLKRDAYVMDLIRQHCQPKCLGKNSTGTPKHPLYVAGDTEPIPYEMGI